MTKILLKTFGALILLSFAPSTAFAQFQILRPEKVSAPAVKPISITDASVKVKERAEKQRMRSTSRRKVSRQGEVRKLPPIEFTSASYQPAELKSHLNPDLYKGPRPASPVPAIAGAGKRSIAVGNKTVAIPDCLTVFESGPDFFTAAMDNALEIDSWQFDPSYKLSTPQAYAKYIERRYGGIEKQATEGNRTELSGFDSKSNRNYFITMLQDGDKLYVTRVLYSSAVARPVREQVIPSLHHD